MSSLDRMKTISGDYDADSGYANAVVVPGDQSDILMEMKHDIAKEKISDVNCNVARNGNRKETQNIQKKDF